MRSHLIASCLLGLLITAPALADTLLIERVQRSDSAAMPRRGSTMDTVRSQYGEPEKAYAAAFVLLAIVILLNFAVDLISRRRKVSWQS